MVAEDIVEEKFSNFRGGDRGIAGTEDSPFC